MTRKTAASLAFALIAAGGFVAAVSVGTGRNRPGCKGLPRLGSSLSGLVASASHPGWLYASSWDARIRLSRDGGQHWIVESSDTPGAVVAAAGSDGETLFAEGSRGLFTSSDDGRSWRPLHCVSYVDDLSVSADGERLALGGSIDLASGQEGGLYVSTNAGRSWRRENQLPRGNLNVNAVLVDAPVPRAMYAASEPGGVLRSMDGGRSFQWRTLGRPSLGFPHGDQVTALAQSAAGGSLWAGTRDHGLFRGSRDGKGWRFAALEHRWVDEIVPDPNERDRLYVAVTDVLIGSRSYSRPEVVVLQDGRRLGRVHGNWHIAASRRTGDVYLWWDRKIAVSRDRGLTWHRLPRFP